jgi:F0F1-type ATP synthase delta subunit
MELKLPSEIVALKDVIEAKGELSLYIDKMIQSIMRHDKPVRYPELSIGLKALAALNQIDLHKEDESRQLLKKLEHLINKAPQVNVSFSDEPPEEALSKLMAWFRKEISPTILFKVGIRPTIGAGMVLQTPLHRYDFSIRRHLMNHQKDLIGAIKG